MKFTTVKYIDGWSWALEVNRRNKDGYNDKAALILSLGSWCFILEFGPGEYAIEWDEYI